MEFQLPQNTLFYLLEKSMKQYRKLAQATVSNAGYDISINQLILLINLREHPSYSQVELAELIFKDFASVARMVELLVNKGFLKRIENQHDRRKKDLILTTTGENMLVELIPLIKKYRVMALDNFTENEKAQIVSSLKKLVRNCEKHLNS